MITLLPVALLGLLVAALRLPLFEVLFSLLLLAPIVAWPLGGAVPLTGATWGILLLIMLGVVVILRGWSGDRTPLRRTELEPLFVFGSGFLLCLLLVMQWPDFIAIGERLRDYAILASVYDHPAEAREPWMAGAQLNYYLYWYRFGQMIAALGALPVWELYHALQAFTFALFVASIFVLFRRGLGWSFRTALLTGILVPFGSNLAGVLFFLRQEEGWWGPSRVIPGAINEFPAWSFLLGDLHPHFLNLALLPFLAAVALRLFASPRGLAAPLALVLPPLCALWVFNANAWEVPIWGAIIAGVVLMYILSRPGGIAAWPGSQLRGAWAQLRSVDGLAVLIVGGFLCASLYLSSRNILPGETPLRWVHDPITQSPLMDLLRHWGFPLIVATACLLMALDRGRERLLGFIGVGAAALSENALPFLAVILFLTLFRLWHLTARARRGSAVLKPAEVFFEALGPVALALIILPEVIFLDDPYGGENERMNTIFKIYSATWFMLHGWMLYLAGATATRLPERLRERLSGPLILAVTTGLFVGFFIHTVDLRRTKDRAIRPIARGLSEINRVFPGAAAAIMRVSAAPAGTVIEAQVGAYDYTGHVATLSGHEAFLGWANHVNLLTREYGEVSRRENRTKEFYDPATECSAKLALMRAEGIAYAVLGPLERKQYAGLAPEQFGCLALLHEEGEYRVFKVPGGAVNSGSEVAPEGG